jgi:hypothetical protein
MALRPMKTLKDVTACIDLYLRQPGVDFLLPDRDASIRELGKAVSRGQPNRVMEREGRIVGWILGAVVKHSHNNFTTLQQLYCCVDDEGLRAVRTVLSLHEWFEEEGVRLGVRRVMSQGSCLDENNSFARLLELHGWSRRGHTALKYL